MSWLKKKSVLVPIDFSELSYSAIAPASEYVEDLSSLKIIHVLSPLHPVGNITIPVGRFAIYSLPGFALEPWLPIIRAPCSVP